MTFAGEGCYYAEYGYGCQSNNPGFHRDVWGEQHVNAATDEEACLHRAFGQWPYCGRPVDRPVTSIYGPTGTTQYNTIQLYCLCVEKFAFWLVIYMEKNNNIQYS